eukprot:2793762-Pleurochrysis_carterae.AAC.2
MAAELSDSAILANPADLQQCTSITHCFEIEAQHSRTQRAMRVYFEADNPNHDVAAQDATYSRIADFPFDHDPCHYAKKMCFGMIGFVWPMGRKRHHFARALVIIKYAPETKFWRCKTKFTDV